MPANQADMEAAVQRGVDIFKIIEDGFDDLVKVWKRGLDLGMVTKVEHDKLVAQTRALKQTTLALHCDGTAIAQANGADIVTGQGGGGGR